MKKKGEKTVCFWPRRGWQICHPSIILSVALQIFVFLGKIEGGCHPMIILASLWDVAGDAQCFKHLVGKLSGVVCV